MNKREEIVSALVGSAIGLVLGYFASAAMFEDAEKCRFLVEENRMLQQMVMDCQEK